MKTFAAASLAMLMSVQPASACEPDIGIEKIRAHLFYANSGELSEDLVDLGPDFIGWNTVIGEGSATGAADDLLVVVEVASGSEEYISDTLDIWVTASDAGPGENDGTLREIGRRSVQGMLIGDTGKVATALYLQDSTCAGKLTIHARLRGEEQSETIHLYCGE